MYKRQTHGCTQVMVERFDPLLVLASVHKERCTALSGVPTMFIAELNNPMFDLFDMYSLRTGSMAGSLCPVELMKRVEEKMFMKVTSVYEMCIRDRSDPEKRKKYDEYGEHWKHADEFEKQKQQYGGAGGRCV